MLFFNEFKKGDTVYYVYPWNYCGWNISRKNKEHDIISISEFEVIAAGKKVIRFKWIEGGQTRKTQVYSNFFDQAFYFKSKEEAEKFAEYAWEQDIYHNEALSILMRREK
jgi:hypothetical protein